MTGFDVLAAALDSRERARALVQLLKENGYGLTLWHKDGLAIIADPVKDDDGAKHD